MLGRAKSVRVVKEDTIIIDGAAKKGDITGVHRSDQSQIADATTDYDRQRLRERMAKLTSGCYPGWRKRIARPSGRKGPT
jgi:chaperonin GroEL